MKTLNTVSAWELQEGGDHYKKLKIQPMEYSMANGLDPLQHTIIKYVTRFRDKDGMQGLLKARHTIDMLIEYEVNNEQAPSTPDVQSSKAETKAGLQGSYSGRRLREIMGIQSQNATDSGAS